MRKDKTRKYKKRKYAKSDDPLEKQMPENCIVCDSTYTILIYHSYYKRTDDYGPDAGWCYEGRTREYKCINCGIYFEIEFSDIYREYYTR